MKVLFADTNSLCRYSTILVARQCFTDITVLESEAFDELNIILAADTIPILFLNINTLSNQAIKQIKTIRDLQPTIRIILVINTDTDYKTNMHLAPYVEGILCLDDTLENSKAYISKILHDHLDVDGNSDEYESLCSNFKKSYRQSIIFLRTYRMIWEQHFKDPTHYLA